MFDKTNWAYNDVNTIFQFCKWADEQTDLELVFREGRKTAHDDVFLVMALVGYIHKREKKDAENKD